MRDNLRTTAGKTTLFIVSSISIFLLIFNVVAGVFLLEYDFYVSTEQEILRRIAGESSAYNEALLKLVHNGFTMRYWVPALAVIFLIISVIVFVALMSVSARRPESDEVYPGPFDKVPYDILLAAGIGVVVIMCMMFSESVRYWEIKEGILLAIFMAISGTFIFLGLSMSLAGRIKNGTLLKNTVIYRVLILLYKLLKGIGSFLKLTFHTCRIGLSKLPLIWKACLALAILCIIDIIGISATYWDVGNTVTFLFIERLILIPLVLWMAWQLRKLKGAAHLMAEGDLNCHISTKRMFGDFKRSAEDLNNIAGGMALAVEDRMKSERMKTELITNVSHDIKTPLTSVINYANLINEEVDKDRIDKKTLKEYSDVLAKHSDRLKHLIEDLVEASKAQTGNLDVCLAPCDAATLINQASGEYEDRLGKSKLSLVTKCPDEAVTIMADSRRMQRIFDNLLGNVCKYALPGTRVYMNLERDGGNVVISLKNTSKEALDISEDELMERFVRGDISRNTDGNGLGLSIAKSLAELQGGELNLSTDGDLFKVTMEFPAVS